MRLFELFDQQYDYTWDEQGGGAWRGYFFLKTNDRVDVRIENWKDGWLIEFSRDKQHSITGEGDAIKIFSTVISMVEEFMHAMKPAAVKFFAEKSGDKASRSKLYDRLIKRFAGKLGYNYDKKTINDKVLYALTRKEVVA